MAIVAYGMFDKSTQSASRILNLDFVKSSDTHHDWYLVPNKLRQINKHCLGIRMYVNDVNVSPYNKYFQYLFNYYSHGYPGFLVINLDIPDSNFDYIVKVEMIDEVFYDKYIYTING